MDRCKKTLIFSCMFKYLKSLFFPLWTNLRTESSKFLSNLVWGLLWGILAQVCGSMDQAQHGQYKNKWGPIFCSNAQAGKVKVSSLSYGTYTKLVGFEFVSFSYQKYMAYDHFCGNSLWGKIQTKNQSEPIWTNLNQSEPIWTNLNQSELSGLLCHIIKCYLSIKHLCQAQCKFCIIFHPKVFQPF